MRFIIEFEGVIADVRAAWYALYRTTAADIGWSRADEATFWRLTRKQGRDADVLRGADANKRKRFAELFAQGLATDSVAADYVVRDEAEELLRLVDKEGSCVCITKDGAAEPRLTHLAAARLDRFCSGLETINSDPRRRPAELRVLSQGDRRTVVVASDDFIIRAAGTAELFAVGVAGGPCSVDRLHAAGADIVYRDVDLLIDSLRGGAPDMIRAGLLPPARG